jgi:hypothetical protein
MRDQAQKFTDYRDSHHAQIVLPLYDTVENSSFAFVRKSVQPD